MAGSFTKLCEFKEPFLDNLGKTELKTLTDLNFNIVVNTQTTLLLCKTKPDKTDCSRQ